MDRNAAKVDIHRQRLPLAQQTGEEKTASSSDGEVPAL
jgi:hypothetical protein